MARCPDSLLSLHSRNVTDGADMLSCHCPLLCRQTGSYWLHTEPNCCSCLTTFYINYPTWIPFLPGSRFDQGRTKVIWVITKVRNINIQENKTECVRIGNWTWNEQRALRLKCHSCLWNVCRDEYGMRWMMQSLAKGKPPEWQLNVNKPRWGHGLSLICEVSEVRRSPPSELSIHMTFIKHCCHALLFWYILFSGSVMHMMHMCNLPSILWTPQESRFKQTRAQDS